MPGIVFAPYDVNNRAWNDAGAKEQNERGAYINTRWAYYDGNHHRWLRVAKGEKDDNVIINLCGRSVDKTAEFIGCPEKVYVDDDPDTQSTANTWLAQAWEEYEYEFSDLVLSGLISGHSFVKLYFDTTGKGAMIALDPTYCVVFWDGMNTKVPLFYRLQWKSGDTVYRQDIVPSFMLQENQDQNANGSVATYWMIYDYTEDRGGTDKWIRRSEQRWEYPFAPLVEWSYKRRPHKYYGVSFLHNAIPLNDVLNFVASNTARILKHHAHPKTFVFGAMVDGDNAVGGIWDGLPADARVETLELTSDLRSSLNMMEILRAEFFANSRVVDTASINDKLGQITNFGVQMLYSDMIEMTDYYRESIERGFSEVLRRVAELNKVAIPTRPELEWPEVLPQNRLELVQAAQAEKDLGTTSLRTLTRSIGRDPEAESELKASEGASSIDATLSAFEAMGNRGLFS